MRKPITFILIWLCAAGVLPAIAAGPHVGEDTFRTPEGSDTIFIPLEGWLTRSGDDPGWAALEFDDSDWDEASVAATEPRTLVMPGETVAWFRLTFTVDSVWAGEPIALIVQMIGASEIYLDGRRILTYGHIGPGEEVTNRIIIGFGHPAIVNLGSGIKHVLAVRHRSMTIDEYAYRDQARAFIVAFGPAESTFDLLVDLSRHILLQQNVFTAASLTFALLHMMLFMFYPASRENLYFAILTAGFAGLAFFPFEMNVTQSPAVYALYLALFKVSLLVVSVFSLRLFYTLFYIRTPRQFWLAVAIGGAMLCLVMVIPLSFYYYVAIASMIGVLRILIIARIKKRSGVIILGIGYGIFALASTVQILAELAWIPRPWGLHQPYMFGILGMLIFMSVYLARDFARKSVTLRNKLIEVKELSQKTIRQEGRAREQEMTQALLEKELAHQSEQLEKAEQLKAAHAELERALYDLRTTQGQLVQSGKMASLGNLVAGVAHEINTPIGAVGSMHDTLRRAVDKMRAIIDDDCKRTECAPRQSLATYLGVIDEANAVIDSGVDRVSNIVRRLRSFARLDEAELKTVDIRDGIDDTLALIRHETKHGIIIDKQYGEVPPVPCFPGRLNQVFLNLLVNAVHAMDGKGEITIITKHADRKVFIIIIDRGAGIPEDKLDKIFDPGFTTKGVGVGTGLGLSICYQIIKDHHGEIKVSSHIGEGTTFTVVFPDNLDALIENG